MALVNGSLLNRDIVRIKISPLYSVVKIFLILSLTAVLPCFAEEEKNTKGVTEDEAAAFEKVEVLTVESRDRADSFAAELEGSGYRPVIVTEESGGKQVYKVFILIPKGEQYNAPAALGQPAQAVGETKPSWGILGRQSRLIHGALTLSGIYTDNVLNSRHNKISDFSTLLSPAIWLMVPHSSENLAPVSLDVRSPGGSELSRQWPASVLHYQAFLYYRPDIPLTSSSGNLRYGTTPAQTVNGRFVIKGNRLSFLFEDEYQYSYLEQEAGVVTKPGELDRYNSNYFGASVSYDTRHRFTLEAGYSNFISRYRSELSSFRNRTDNGLSGILTYKLTPRVGLLGEYRFFDISYSHTRALDSKEHYFLGGVSWDVTAKSKGLFKAGYGIKDLGSPSGSYNDFSLELQLDHRFTPKTSVVASAYRKTNETDISGAAFTLVNGLEVQLRQVLTPKLTSSVGFLADNEHYKELNGLTDIADSTIYQWNAALQYAFRRWLRGTVGYAYTIKNASIPEFQYSSNTFFFNAIASF